MLLRLLFLPWSQSQLAPSIQLFGSQTLELRFHPFACQTVKPIPLSTTVELLHSLVSAPAASFPKYLLRLTLFCVSHVTFSLFASCLCQSEDKLLWWHHKCFLFQEENPESPSGLQTQNGDLLRSAAAAVSPPGSQPVCQMFISHLFYQPKG